MVIYAYLVINDRGTLKVTKNKPALNNDEIAIKLNLDIPQAFFDRLIPSVNIKIPQDSVALPNLDLALSITSHEVAKALRLDVQTVHDGLKEMVENYKKQKEEDTVGVV